MIANTAEESRHGQATSGAATEDGQSSRQPQQVGNNPTTAVSEAPTASFRNVNPTERYTTSSSQQQRRGNLVLFVKSNENDPDGQSRAVTNFSLQDPRSNGGNSAGGNNGSMAQSGSGEDGNGDEEPEGLASLVVSVIASSGTTVVDTFTGAAKKPLLTAALVLLYFILLDMVLLHNNERLNRILRRTRAADDDALVLLSSSLVRQLTDAKEELQEALAQQNPPMLLERLEMVQHKALALERVCNRSIERLHAHLMFPGSVADLYFLIEEHVGFDAQLQRLAGEELEWAQTVMSTAVVQMHGDVPERQRYMLGRAAAAQAHLSTGQGADEAREGGADADAAASTSAAARAAAEEELSNPLRNVRLERVRGAGAVVPVPTSARTKTRLAHAAASAAKPRHTKRKGEVSQLAAELDNVEAAAGGLLGLLRNKVIAFFIICVLLSCVLRMG